MLQHDNARPHVARICTQFLEAENIPVLAWPSYSPDMSPIVHVWIAGLPYTTACSSSCQYPANSHSHWRGVDQYSTGHNQQPDQLYAKEMCCNARGKWWSFVLMHWLVVGTTRFCICALCAYSLVWTVLKLKCSAWHTIKWEYAVGCICSDCSLALWPEGKSYPSVVECGIRCCGDVFLRAAERAVCGTGGWSHWWSSGLSLYTAWCRWPGRREALLQQCGGQFPGPYTELCGCQW